MKQSCLSGHHGYSSCARPVLGSPGYASAEAWSRVMAHCRSSAACRALHASRPRHELTAECASMQGWCACRSLSRCCAACLLWGLSPLAPNPIPSVNERGHGCQAGTWACCWRRCSCRRTGRSRASRPWRRWATRATWPRLRCTPGCCGCSCPRGPGRRVIFRYLIAGLADIG